MAPMRIAGDAAVTVCSPMISNPIRLRITNKRTIAMLATLRPAIRWMSDGWVEK